jgi:MoxR-like ATPase
MNENRERCLQLTRLLNESVLLPMKSHFVDKDEIIDLLGTCLVAGENLFMLGPPGTAKSALVHEMARLIEGRSFDYLLTRFTEPNELFGPFDIRKLREGELITNTEGMLPEASFVFLDELLNANSAILNSLLQVLNERIFRRGRETRRLPLLMVVAASNRLPEDEALHALFDRFLIRVHCDNVGEEHLRDVLDAGWAMERRCLEKPTTITADEIKQVQQMLVEVDLKEVRPAYLNLVLRLRKAGIPISDRRAVKLQRMIAASSLACGRFTARPSDMWVVRYTWETEEQQEVIANIVAEAIRQSECEPGDHPRSRGLDKPDPEVLAHDLEVLADSLKKTALNESERAVAADQLQQLSSRCEWVPAGPARDHLAKRVEALWELVRTAQP